MEVIMKKNKDVGDFLSAEHAHQKAVNRSYLRKVLQNVIYLARQGLSFRGNWIPAGESSSGGSEQESNFHQLMLLRANDDPNILEVMG